ncbi:MAG TPA: hypothetical protein VIB01_06175 [Steroidobacteraceae bacterium]|jgi:hypothetical protein
MFVFKRPFAAVSAGLLTACIGVCLDVAFASAWTAQHAAAVL